MPNFKRVGVFWRVLLMAFVSCLLAAITPKPAHGLSVDDLYVTCTNVVVKGITDEATPYLRISVTPANNLSVPLVLQTIRVDFGPGTPFIVAANYSQPAPETDLIVSVGEWDGASYLRPASLFPGHCPPTIPVSDLSATPALPENLQVALPGEYRIRSIWDVPPTTHSLFFVRDWMDFAYDYLMPIEWSPDGTMFSAIDDSEGLIVDIKHHRIFDQGMSSDAGFWKWTADSRFAIFSWLAIPEENSGTYVFDTATWQMILATPGCPPLPGNKDPEHAWVIICGDDPLALSPTDSRFLMENGTLVDLPALHKTDILANWRGNANVMISNAAWSPGGASLAILTFTGYGSTYYTLYLASGDGTTVRKIALIDPSPEAFFWQDNKTLIIQTSNDGNQTIARQYTIDAVTGQAQ